jgi:hypothetical protein
MPIDPDIEPVLDALEQRMQAQIDAQRVRLDEQSRHLSATGDMLNAQHAEIIALRRRIEALENPTPVWTPAFPGDVKPGTIRWGAAIGGNADPVARHEAIAGRSMGVRRTFWDMTKTASLVTTATADIAAGRVPWVSVKLGTTWKNVAAGSIDGALDSLFKRLAALPGPVWFTAHHEPENDPADGTAADWRAMQTRVRRVLDASGAKNVAFAPILMSWTFDTRSGRIPTDWWVDDIWDFAGVDHYKDNFSTTPVAGLAMWMNTEKFYSDRGVRIAVGEWADRGTDIAAADRMTAWRDHLISIGSPGCAYFDSGLNATNGSWELKGEPLIRFRNLMTNPTSVTLKETP